MSEDLFCIGECGKREQIHYGIKAERVKANNDVRGNRSPIKVKTTTEWLIGKLYVVKSMENYCFGDRKGANQLQRGEAIVNILAI